MSDLYEFTVEWPSTTARSVIVTGDFDKWSQSLRLSRSAANDFFTATIKVPYGCPTRYKFIVDGEWLIKPDQPTEYSPEGYLNNVYYVPLKPSANGKVESGKGPTGEALGITDWKDTIVASAGTSSALSYVASGLGETVRSVVGLDPYNSNQIAIPTPITPSSSIGFPSPATDDTTTTNPESAGSNSVAPLVPIKIVPVYAKENCTIDPTKVVSDEESIGTFVGLRPRSEDDIKGEIGGAEGRKGENGQEAPASPSGIPDIVTSSPEEPAALVAVEAPKVEEKPTVEAAEPASAPQPAPVATSGPAGEEKASVSVLEETPKKVEEPQVATPASESTPAPAAQPTTNKHAQDPSSTSTKVVSSRPTTPKPTDTPAPAESVATSPTSTVRKSNVLPQPGKGLPSKASTNGGSTDEFGVQGGKGTTGKKKRTSSFFGSLRKLFHHEHHEKDKEKRKSTH